MLKGVCSAFTCQHFRRTDGNQCEASLAFSLIEYPPSGRNEQIRGYPTNTSLKQELFLFDQFGREQAVERAVITVLFMMNTPSTEAGSATGTHMLNENMMTIIHVSTETIIFIIITPYHGAKCNKPVEPKKEFFNGSDFDKQRYLYML